MSEAPKRTTCSEAREWIQLELDGDGPDRDRLVGLRRHLQECAACKETETGLRTVHETLRGLPEIEFPAEALDEVRRRTWGRSRPRHRWLLDWRAAAAAAALIGGVIWGFLPSGPTDAEVALAAAQTRRVFRLTAQALRKAERAALQEVLAGEVSPALRKVPIHWPGAAKAPEREPEI